MTVDRIKHTKPASERTYLDELEPIPYEITEEELASMDPRMKKILFGIEEREGGEEGAPPAEPKAKTAKRKAGRKKAARAPEAEEEPWEEERWDPASIADFPPAEGRTITVVFAAGDGDEEVEELARAAQEHREVEREGRSWHAVRCGVAGAGELKRLNELLGVRDDVVVLVNGARPPYARSLWLPLMYIFTAGIQD